MKKILISLFAILIVVAGCSKDSKSGKVEIEFMHSMVEQERLAVIDELIAMFEKANPDISVKSIPVEEDAYNTKVTALGNSGEMPDVLEVSQDFARVLDNDQFIDVKANSEVIANVGEDKYYEGALKLMKSENGKDYLAVPMSGWVQGIWYSKSKFAENNLASPSKWEDILKAATTLNKPDDKKYGIAIPTAESVFTEQAFSQYALSNGANVVDEKGNVTIDTPEMKEALEFYANLAKLTMSGSNDVTEVKDAFSNSSTSMAMYSTYILPSVFESGKSDDLAYAIPTNKAGAVYGTTSGLAITVNKSKEELEATKKFSEFLMEPENNVKWILMSPGGMQPVLSDVANLDEYKNNEVITAFGDVSTKVAESFNEVQVFGLVDDKNFNVMGNITSSGLIGKMVNSVVVGGVSVDEALKTAQKEAEELTK